MKDSIKLERIYNYRVDDLWNALTSAEAMSEWLMPCDMVPKVGHKFNFKTKPQGSFDGIVHCEVLEVVPRQKLVFSWCSGKMNTIVSFKLEALGEGTKLYLEHTGFSSIFERVFIRQLLKKGWKKKILQQLDTYLDK